MRIRHKGRNRLEADQVIDVTVDYQGSSLLLRAKVNWIRKSGLLSTEIGLEFTGMTPPTAAALRRMALASAKPTALN